MEKVKIASLYSSASLVYPVTAQTKNSRTDTLIIQIKRNQITNKSSLENTPVNCLKSQEQTTVSWFATLFSF